MLIQDKQAIFIVRSFSRKNEITPAFILETDDFDTDIISPGDRT
jgi:hypothetical protein